MTFLYRQHYSVRLQFELEQSKPICKLVDHSIAMVSDFECLALTAQAGKAVSHTVYRLSIATGTACNRNCNNLDYNQISVMLTFNIRLNVG